MIQDCKFVKMVTITINKNLAAWVLNSLVTKTLSKKRWWSEVLLTNEPLNKQSLWVGPLFTPIEHKPWPETNPDSHTHTHTHHWRNLLVYLEDSLYPWIEKLILEKLILGPLFLKSPHHKALPYTKLTPFPSLGPR